MRKSVAKFGGTSVKTACAINHVAQILMRNLSIRFVVVSAVGGVTNKLVEFCQASLKQRRQIISELKVVHLELAKDLMLSQKVCSKIENKIDDLGSCFTQLGVVETDDILALGEDLSSMIIYEFIQQKGISITLLDAREFIITDEHFGRATPEISEIKKLISAKVAQIPLHHIIITQGFIGATKKGKTTTLGRGGSDYSAALIAESIEADQLCIYTDVPGVYTMDPNVVKNAHLIPKISFQGMAEMANFGAKILHPATLTPCIRSHIPVMVLSTFEPEKGGTCVAVNEEQDMSLPLIRAITMRESQILVTIKSLSMLNAYGFLANIFSILAKYKINVDLITISEVSVALTIDKANINSSDLDPFANQELVTALENFADVTIESDLTLIAIVGARLTIPGVVQGVLSRLGNNFIRLVCYGASGSSIGILVRHEDAYQVAKVLHKELLEKNRELEGTHCV